MTLQVEEKRVCDILVTSNLNHGVYNFTLHDDPGGWLLLLHDLQDHDTSGVDVRRDLILGSWICDMRCL